MTITYDEYKGLSFPDGIAKDELRKLILKGDDITIGTTTLMYALRTLIKSHEVCDIIIMYKGNVIEYTNDGKLSTYPELAYDKMLDDMLEIE